MHRVLKPALVTGPFVVHHLVETWSLGWHGWFSWLLVQNGSGEPLYRCAVVDAPCLVQPHTVATGVLSCFFSRVTLIGARAIPVMWGCPSCGYGGWEFADMSIIMQLSSIRLVFFGGLAHGKGGGGEAQVA